MWRKAEENKAQPPPGTSPSGLPASPNAPVRLSQGIRIKGEISGRGDLFLDGVFEGNIHISDGSLTVGPNARVTAGIEAREIIVHGEVIGTLKGARVQVSGTGRVTGDMETRGIVIEDGAVLRSKVQVRQEDKPPQPPPPAVLPRAKEAAAAAGAQAKDQEQ